MISINGVVLSLNKIHDKDNSGNFLRKAINIFKFLARMIAKEYKATM